LGSFLEVPAPPSSDRIFIARRVARCALHEVGGIFTCRIAPLDYAYRQFSREWDRTVDGSPNRPDDMVWGLMRLSKVITQISIA
jgi:hypothetical protein